MPVTLEGTYYTIKETAERLGYLAISNLANACKAGKIPAHKVGNTWLIPESWILEQEHLEINGKGNRGVSRK